MSQPDPLFDDLYRELILDHYRKPRNRGVLEGAAFHAEGLNPVCGDEILIDLAVNAGRIDDIRFSGQGCSISQASASMLTVGVQGRSIVEARELMTRVRAMLIDGAPPHSELGDLEALEGVAKLPVRVKCALLCWNVLEEGLKQAETAA